MLIVHTAPAVAAERSNGWNLSFWLGQPFDYQIPFRAALEEIALTLGLSKPTKMQLPVFMDGEDFVEGHLSFGDATIGIYYEHSLGYLSLFGKDRATLDEIEALTRPLVHIV